MTQKEKSLLLQDICARLPYNLYVRIEEFNVPKNEAITEGFVGNYLKDNRCNDYDADDILNELADDCICIKPYLRLMSSMTEEERKEYKHLVAFSGSPEGAVNFVDWLNKKMFAYRTLDGKDMFELDLALEAPNDMYN